ncbi:FecR domain-containing protein [Methylobacillus methanolivorans]|uniref:FecR domain-containing protein n=1 Tax=Methylobacillus methanolivorans TaxID=1848927 RepID=A0ABW8GMB7_9PROT
MDKAIALQAAEWFFRLQEAEASEADQRACAAWRAADPMHETAWQRAQQVSGMLGGVPGKLAHATLQRSHVESRRNAIKAMALLVVAGGAAWQGSRSEPVRLRLAQYSTRTGELRQIHLADGTLVHLNTSTGINTAINAQQRLIELEMGEVLIQTGKAGSAGHAAYRPLVIATRYGQLQPLGTRFIVRQSADDIRLSVLEGAVAITTREGHQQVIEAGRQTRFNDHVIMPPVALADHADSWTRGVLHVREMRLVDFASELARYRHGVVRCSTEVADIRISGAFQIADTDQVFASLPMMVPVKVSYLTRYWISVNAANAGI